MQEKIKWLHEVLKRHNAWKKSCGQYRVQTCWSARTQLAFFWHQVLKNILDLHGNVLRIAVHFTHFVFQIITNKWT